MSARSILMLFLGVLTVLLCAAVSTAQSCPGDCDGSGDVSVNELIVMVNIALGSAPVADCRAGDSDGNGEISIAEIIAAVNAALNGCNGVPRTPTPTPMPMGTTHMVLVGEGFTFSPSNLTIQVGDTVQWTWSSSGHTVTSGSQCNADGQFCSPSDSNCASAPLSSQGATYSHTFSTAGTFPYFCIPHCDFGMVGTIVVQPAAAP
jgi:plastocyanin